MQCVVRPLGLYPEGFNVWVSSCIFSIMEVYATLNAISYYREQMSGNSINDVDSKGFFIKHTFIQFYH